MQTFTLPVVEPPEQNLPSIQVVGQSPAVVGEGWTADVTITDDDSPLDVYLDDESLARDVDVVPSGDQWQITWTPTADDLGEHQISVFCDDGDDGIAWASLAITVIRAAGTNAPPTIQSKPEGPAWLRQLWTYQVVASDPDGDDLDYHLDDESLTRGMTSNGNGLVSWVPTEEGSFSFTLTVLDGQGGWACVLKC